MSLETIYEAILKGDAKTAAAETQAALDAGISAPDILHQACIPAMTEVGRLFEIGEKFVPEMLIAARAMQKALVILKPLLVEAEVQTMGKVVIGTVAGDLHDIGKNLVAMMLEGGGFEIVDLGINLPPERFIEAIREHEPDVVGLSALLMSTMPAMQKTIAAIAEQGLRDRAKIIVGGAPVTQVFADEIGADGYAPDAAMAVELTRSLLG